MLIDVPCTGTGTFRRHPDARWRLKVSDLAVHGRAAALDPARRGDGRAPGGLLIYSTCSLEPEENDAQIESFLADNPEWRLEPPPEGAVPPAVLDAGRLRVLPQRHGTDGAFAARLRQDARRELARAIAPLVPYWSPSSAGFSLAYLLVAFVVFPARSSRAT